MVVAQSLLSASPAEDPRPNRAGGRAEFSAEDLAEVLQATDWLPFLRSIITWITKFPPLSQVGEHDRRVLLRKSWHSLFLFHLACHFDLKTIQSRRAPAGTQVRRAGGQVPPDDARLPLGPATEPAGAVDVRLRHGAEGG